MRIAVVGTGVAGLVAAHLLHGEHELTVYEAGDWIGGHTNTVDVETPDGGRLAVDTGFIVFNERTYPELCALFRRLGVAWQPSDMSFAVRCERTGLEYNGTSLDALFAQRRNLVRPAFWRMVRDVLRFYRAAPALLEDEGEGPTLAEYLRRGRYSREFVDWHLIPMASAVWSARPGDMLACPARFLVRFFHNHAFLQVEERPQWLVVRGGSREYVRRLVRPFADRIRTRTPVERVRRGPGGVRVRAAGGDEQVFDRVVLACHGDQALRLLAEPSDREREVLGAFRYQRNVAVLHTDARLLPRRRRARASWNYHLTDPPAELPAVTYWMNRLQSLPGDVPYLVTLNREDAIDPRAVLRRFVYHHPVYTRESVRAQARHGEIDGVDGVHFCGAHWGWGFHEDGVRSALAVARNLGRAPLEVAS